MTITGSIYMVVVISIERSRAILSPFQKSLSWVPFLCFVIGLSVFVNLPKFLEFKVRPSTTAPTDYLVEKCEI